MPLTQTTDVSNQSSSAIEIYTRRWFLLAATCACTILNQFLSKSFGAVNKILIAYFDVSLAELDWASVGLYVGTTFITPVFAYLCYAKLIGFRAMSISGSSCLLLSCLCILLAVQYPFLFPVMVAATLLQGVSFCVSFSVGSFFAVLWFPDREVGLAIACNAAAMAAGGVLGSILPPALLTPSPLTRIQENATASFINHSNQFEKWEESTYISLMWIYSTVAIVLILLLLFLFVCAQDSPPKAPTFALALKRNVGKTMLRNVTPWKGFVSCIKELVKDKTYLLCVALSGVTLHLIVVEMLHLTQLIGKVVRDSNMKVSVSLTSGFIISAFAASAFASSFISAKLLLYFQRYAGQVVVGTGLMLVSGMVILLSYYCNSLVGFYIGNVALGMAARICTIPLFEIVTRHTYPKDEALVTVWMAGAGTAVLVVLSGTARLVAKDATPGSALIFMCVVIFITFTLSFLLKPRNKRGEFDRKLREGDVSLNPDVIYSGLKARDFE